jgi:hypothetical protein
VTFDKYIESHKLFPDICTRYISFTVFDLPPVGTLHYASSKGKYSGQGQSESALVPCSELATAGRALQSGLNVAHGDNTVRSLRTLDQIRRRYLLKEKHEFWGAKSDSYYSNACAQQH